MASEPLGIVQGVVEALDRSIAVAKAEAAKNAAAGEHVDLDNPFTPGTTAENANALAARGLGEFGVEKAEALAQKLRQAISNGNLGLMMQIANVVIANLPVANLLPVLSKIPQLVV